MTQTPVEPGQAGECQRDLRRQLEKIRRTFAVESLLTADIDESAIVAYYTKSNPGYRFFHSHEGAIHMALNPGGKFDEDGYLGQVKLAQGQLDDLRATSVLELGSGAGFNSIHLAAANPGAVFRGIDLTPTHVRAASKQAEHRPNLKFDLGSFEELPYADNAFDLVFVVESICHASNMTRALSESHRGLRPSGRLLVIDGFRRPGFDSLPDDLRVAARLSEVSMAVANPYSIDAWLSLAAQCNFAVVKVDDLTAAIQPNLLRLQHLAKGFFKFPVLTRLLLSALPKPLTRNSIAGLLMPLTTTCGAQGYWSVVLERPLESTAPDKLKSGVGTDA